MSRREGDLLQCCERFPRVSGDEPFHNDAVLVGMAFSPRERG